MRSGSANRLASKKKMTVYETVAGARGAKEINIPQERADDTVLVSPFRRGSISQALGLSLKHLRFFLSLAVDAIQRDDLKRLVQEARVLVLRRRGRQRD